MIDAKRLTTAKLTERREVHRRKNRKQRERYKNKSQTEFEIKSSTIAAKQKWRGRDDERTEKSEDSCQQLAKKKGQRENKVCS